MSFTIVEMLVKVVPVHLFRSGSKNSPQLHKLRTMPPRTIEESFDIQIVKQDGVDYVLKDTGGISTFDAPKAGFGLYWWRIPRGTRIPAGLRISRDYNPKPFYNATHYTIRPLYDMPLHHFISLLESFAMSAERMFEVEQKKRKEV